MMSVQKQYSLSHSISVNKATCEYTGVIKFNVPNADVPFPETCDPPLLAPGDVPTPYKFGKEFYKATGFDHLGLDWQPCGHPDPSKFGKPHFDFHLYRITPAQRDLMTCDLIEGAPVCAFPGGPSPDDQTTSSGRKFFAVGTVVGTPDHPDTGKFANMPELFTVDLGSAVPHSGIHLYNVAGAVDVSAWTNPMLVMGSYDSKIAFWEPMFPYSFVSGDTSNFYEESVTYVQQTTSFPAYYSVSYDSSTEFTTVTLKGKYVDCVPSGAGKASKKFN